MAGTSEIRSRSSSGNCGVIQTQESKTVFRHIKHIHFVGIGGIGMSGIAEVLINMGYEVSGSDLRTTEITNRLDRLGATIFSGHHPSHIEGADVVVYSSAVKLDNPEVVAAEESKIPVIPRAEMLAELMRMKYGVAIAGTHGKTTTTSMIASVLRGGGLDPTIVVGGRLRGIDTNAKLGEGEYLVAEADESDKSFLKLSPTIAVITTIDEEHLDNYRDLKEIEDTFLAFANKVPFYGCAILCLDEEPIQKIIPQITRKVVTYGLISQADIVARDVELNGFKSAFKVKANGDELGGLTLKIPGEHNVSNALAAIAVGLELGVEQGAILQALGEFAGVRRRFEVRGEERGVLVVDDYAHHPTEVELTLRAARRGWKGRIIAVFQPHLYTRTVALAERFGRSFYHADEVVITDVYPSREDPLPGVNGELIARAARDFGHRQVTYIEDKRSIGGHLLEMVKRGDMVITLGAGDIYKIADELVDRLRERGEG